MRRYAPLGIGLLVAVAVPALGVGSWIAGALADLAPLPWSGIGVGILIFLASTAIYFRQQWVGSLTDIEIERQREQAAARLVREACSDGGRWLHVIQENLALIASGTQRPQEAELYMHGAQAHADKLLQVLERLQGIARQLDQAAPPAHHDENA